MIVLSHVLEWLKGLPPPTACGRPWLVQLLWHSGLSPPAAALVSLRMNRELCGQERVVPESDTGHLLVSS